MPHVQRLIFCSAVPGTVLHQYQELISLLWDQNYREKDDKEDYDPAELTCGYLITIAHGSERHYHKVHRVMELQDIR